MFPEWPRAPDSRPHMERGQREWAEYEAARARYDDFERRRKIGYYRRLWDGRFRCCLRCGRIMWHAWTGRAFFDDVCHSCYSSYNFGVMGRAFRRWDWDKTTEGLLAFELAWSAKRGWIGDVWMPEYRGRELTPAHIAEIMPQVIRNTMEKEMPWRPPST